MVHTFSSIFYIRKEKAGKDKKAPIYCRVTVDGQRAELAIKRSVAIDKWDNAGRVKGHTEEARNINNYIDIVRHKIYTHQKELVDNNKPVTANAIKSLYLGVNEQARSLIQLFEEHNIKFEELVGKQYAAGTLTIHKTTLIHLKQFIKDHYKVTDYLINDVDLKFLTDFDHFLRTTKSCANNTTLKYLKNLKKIVHNALANGIINKDPYLNYKVKVKKVDRGYLTNEELDTLAKKVITIPRLDAIRDIFLFQCYTGLAYADVSTITPDNIVKGNDGGLWLSAKRTKTDENVKVPILPNVQAIIDKYKEHPAALAKGTLLPVPSNQKTNAYLKEIGDLCGFNKTLSTHLARHTFATTVTLSNGVSLEVVSKLLSHSSINSTRIYARMLDNRVSEEMDTLKGKLKVA
jgi:integrase